MRPGPKGSAPRGAAGGDSSAPALFLWWARSPDPGSGQGPGSRLSTDAAAGRSRPKRMAAAPASARGGGYRFCDFGDRGAAGRGGTTGPDPEDSQLARSRRTGLRTPRSSPAPPPERPPRAEAPGPIPAGRPAKRMSGRSTASDPARISASPADGRSDKHQSELQPLPAAHPGHGLPVQ